MSRLLIILLTLASISSLLGQDTLSHQEKNILFQRGLSAQKKGEFAPSNQYFKQAKKQLKASKAWDVYLEAQNQIARNCWKMEKLDSASLVCQSIATSPHLKKGSLIEATLFNNIGVIHDIRAEYKEALNNFHQSLEIRKEKLGDDHIETEKLYYNIGACYELQSQFNASLEYRKKALRNFKKNLSPNHPFFLAVYKGMMNTYFFLEKYEEVIAYIETALSIAKKIYPANHPRIGYFYRQLGIAKTKIPSSKKEGIQLVKKGLI
ncbi:MAG: tetratricopeptide repeat protein [Aureispira sp.]